MADEYMNNYFMSFSLLTHFGVNKICATGVLNTKQIKQVTQMHYYLGQTSAKKKKKCGHFEQRT